MSVDAIQYCSVIIVCPIDGVSTNVIYNTNTHVHDWQLSLVTIVISTTYIRFYYLVFNN